MEFFWGFTLDFRKNFGNFIDFTIKNGQKVKTAKSFMERMSFLLKSEHIEFDKKVLAELIQKYYPDFRRTINELQRYSVRGKIDSGILFSLSEANNKELVKTLKAKKYLKVIGSLSHLCLSSEVV